MTAVQERVTTPLAPAPPPRPPRSRIAWAAVAAVARRELRRGWVSLVVIGLVAGLAGAVATGALVVERRTATAESRLQVAMGVEDLRVSALGGTIPDLTGIAGVERTWNPSIAVGRVRGDGLMYYAVTSGPPHPGIFDPVVVQGRPVDADALDEVEIEESAAAAAGWGVGTTFTLDLLSADQVDEWNAGVGTPRGPAHTFRVVGLFRITPKPSGGVAIQASPRFYREVGRANSQGGVVMIQTRDGVSPESVAQQLTERAGGSPLQFEFSSQEPAPVRTASHILTAGALSFLVVAALVGVLALLQFSARHHAGGVPAQRVERILGLTSGERVLGHATPSLLSAVVAGVLTAAGGVAAGFLEPLGSLKGSEPYPGFRGEPLLTVAGASVTALVVVLVAALAAARAPSVRTTPTTPRRSLRLRRSAVASAAVRLSGGTRGSFRPGSAAAGVALAVAGMLAALTVSASLGHLTGTPRNWGVNADLSVADARPDLYDPLMHDPRVGGMTYTAASRARVDGLDVTSYAHRKLLGDVTWTFISGRGPVLDREIALGPRLAEQSGAGVGDVVTVDTPHGPEFFSVVGVGTGLTNGEAFGANALFTTGGMEQTGQTDRFYNLDVVAAPGADVDALAAELARNWELYRPAEPAEVASLGDLGHLPVYLAVFFLVVGVGAMAHGCVLVVRRRRRDLAVLHTIGFTRSQVVRSLLGAALITAVAGLLIGLPLGLLGGRLVWREVADGIGVVPGLQLPWTAVAVLVPATLVVALALALPPALSATRHPLSRDLRTD